MLGNAIENPAVGLRRLPSTNRVVRAGASQNYVFQKINVNVYDKEEIQPAWGPCPKSSGVMKFFVAWGKHPIAAARSPCLLSARGNRLQRGERLSAIVPAPQTTKNNKTVSGKKLVKSSAFGVENKTIVKCQMRHDLNTIRSELDGIRSTIR
jgi:hypothetical protein